MVLNVGQVVFSILKLLFGINKLEICQVNNALL